MNSPILQAERRYQQRSRSPIRRVWLRRLYRGVIGVGLIASGLVFAFELLWALTIIGIGGGMFFSVASFIELIVVLLLPVGVLIPLALLLDFSLILRTLLLAANTITREKQSGTWSLLLLSNQSARQIVIGKWCATVRSLAPQYLVLAGLRVGIIIYFGLERYRINEFYISPASAQIEYILGGLPFYPTVLTLLIGVALITLFTFGNLLFTAGFGLLIALVRGGQHAGEQAAIALALRTILLVLPALLLIGGAHQILVSEPLSSDNTAVICLNALGFSLLDNGTQLSAAALTAPRYALNYAGLSPPFFYMDFYPPEVIGYTLGIYGLIMIVSLADAIWIVRRQTD